MSDETPLDDNTVKHLEFLQSVISRLAGNSFLIKGWALTIAAAFYGFSVGNAKWSIAFVGLFPIIMFWGLDAYFLHREQLFRDLYKAVWSGTPHVARFDMPYMSFINATRTYWAAFWSKTLMLFYISLICVGAALTFVVAVHWLP
jgi:hypothetical protein